MARIYINDEWGFTEEFSDELNFSNCNKALKAVRIPHTVKELPFNYFDEKSYQMVSGYRRVIEAPKDWEGKTVLLTFEAVGHVAEVFLNGKKLAIHRCGYTAFTVDISDEIIFNVS